MTQDPASGGLPGSVVLGISVVDDQIASVVRDADGHILASNLVDLPDPSAPAVEAAIVELVDSVPVVVDLIGVSVSREDVRKHLSQAFGSSGAAESWHDRVVVTGYASALAEIACTHATRGGVVAVVDLDREAAPASGTTVATVDTTSGAVLGTADFTTHRLASVTDPDGASALATAIAKLPRGRDITSIIVVGPGAEMPGIAPAFEYAAQRPVTVADNPPLASAIGAADAALVALSAPAAATRVSTGRRWWFVGAAIGAAVFLGAVGLTLLLAAEGETPEPTQVTVTETPAAVTITADAKTVTQTETETGRARTTTITSTPRPVTRTTTVTEEIPGPFTITETETTTVEVPAAGSPAP
ncbi:hypothetical protein HGA04_24265 [Gordonia rubripertincta]|uniref:FHA domain-containing protein n=2 Tax=Gordonia rubripertincta TaxID=36822 RepID=A0AAW6RGM6_GORRU|nr:hypothetical protein [Gordonia rubripertincta]MDG6783671.1 hypothetical protein [Gordonia rubripertincta]NKY65746.1 hypothetical protein [Gordonia rubripertincta]GAB84114.1 hypothetical protein GORBP_032_00310 [Gordonia rubripertincta NBRC 101908]